MNSYNRAIDTQILTKRGWFPFLWNQPFFQCFIIYGFLFAAIMVGPSQVYTAPAIGIVGGSFPETQASGDPIELSAYLKNLGLDTTILGGFEISKPDVLDPKKIDILIFPNAPYFPMCARETFLDFLKAGGSFIALGGYAFDTPCDLNGQTWTPIKDLPVEQQLSARFGKAGDTMGLRPDQISIFDPTYLFERVKKIVSSPRS